MSWQHPMSRIEEDCRWLIVQAYAAWLWRSGQRRMNLRAYWLALDLD